MDDAGYLSGYGNTLSSEALSGALPRSQSSPQRAPYGLYAEQLSGTAFTRPRGENLRTWMYRIQPSVVQGRYEPLATPRLLSPPLAGPPPDPNAMRWDPLPIPDAPTDFVDGLVTFAVNGDVRAASGCSVHLFAANRSMERRCFTSADGHLLLVAQLGRLAIRTELGDLDVRPGEIALLPRGLKFSIRLPDGVGRGWVCENHGAPWRLPDRGPIGANSLANERHFLAPRARYEEDDGDWELVARFCGATWSAPLRGSPFDVVAWTGNYAPFKYDLALFQAVNTVDFDHPDPSIFTVLTSPTDTPGRANADFVIFPPRWMVGEHTFRPPYYHRNVMSEFMGLVTGVYDAKEGGGFVPGGSSLHNCMTPHGPDAATSAKASIAPLEPHKLEGTLAFMFESCLPFQVTEHALHGGLLQVDYQRCWQDLPRAFDPSTP